MKSLLLKFACWVLVRYCVKYLILPESVLAIAPVVKEVVQKTSDMPGLLSNEYRHAHTYATIKKKYPDVPSRDVGLCIELVIYGLL